MPPAAPFPQVLSSCSSSLRCPRWYGQRLDQFDAAIEEQRGYIRNILLLSSSFLPSSTSFLLPSFSSILYISFPQFNPPVVSYASFSTSTPTDCCFPSSPPSVSSYIFVFSSPFSLLPPPPLSLNLEATELDRDEDYGGKDPTV
eukprot:748616-Hanusia_phi.AAC.1